MPKEREWRFLLAALALSDLVCILAAFAIAAWLRAQPALGAHRNEDYGILILPILPVFALIFLIQGLYDRQNLLGGMREYAAVFRACTYGLVALILVGFALHVRISREWSVLSWALAITLVGTMRFAIRRVAYVMRHRGYFTIRAIVVGADAHSVAVASQLSRGGSGVEVVGFLDNYLPTGTVLVGHLRVLGPPAALAQIAARTHLHEAIVVPQALPWEMLQNLMIEAAAAPNALRLSISGGIYDLLTTSVRLSERNHVPLLTVNKARLTPFETAFKTTLDYGVAITLLILFAPVLAFVAVWLRIHAPGVILERRPVTGRYGKQFHQLSFPASIPLHGNFIRKLPGLFNVLTGDLSIVGPRPISGHESTGRLRQYRMLTIRPGLTGPWRQVNGVEQQAVLDLYYIRSYSIWLDLQVLFRRLASRLPRARRVSRRRADRAALQGRSR